MKEFLHNIAERIVVALCFLFVIIVLYGWIVPVAMLIFNLGR